MKPLLSLKSEIIINTLASQNDCGKMKRGNTCAPLSQDLASNKSYITDGLIVAI